MRTFHYEKPTNDKHLIEGPLVRILYSEDSKLTFMATCMNEDTAKTIVEALNSMAPVDTTEPTEEATEDHSNLPVPPTGYHYYVTERYWDPEWGKVRHVQIYQNARGQKWGRRVD